MPCPVRPWTAVCSTRQEFLNLMRARLLLHSRGEWDAARSLALRGVEGWLHLIEGGVHLVAPGCWTLVIKDVDSSPFQGWRGESFRHLTALHSHRLDLRWRRGVCAWSIVEEGSTRREGGT